MQLGARTKLRLNKFITSLFLFYNRIVRVHNIININVPQQKTLEATTKQKTPHCSDSFAEVRQIQFMNGKMEFRALSRINWFILKR